MGRRVRFIVHYQHVFSFWTRSPRLITEHDTEIMPTLRIANKDSFINVIVTTRGKWGITKPQETRRYSNHMNVNLKSKTPVNNCWLFVIIEPSRLEKEVGAFKLQSADSFIFFFPVHKHPWHAVCLMTEPKSFCYLYHPVCLLWKLIVVE